MSSRSPRFIFLGGTGRSGTTLMHKILCSSSLVAGTAEFDHLLPLMEIRGRMLRPEKLERQHSYYDARELDDAWRTFVTSLLLRPMARKPDAHWLAEKTPANVAAIPELLSLFPQSRFIAMVRDPRDVVASHLDIRTAMKKQNPAIARRWLREFDPLEVGRTWKRNLHQIESAGRSNESSRLKVVRYESLVTEPEATVLEICEFLGVPFERGMLAPEQLNADASGHAANIDGVWYDQQRFARPINASSVGRWRRALPPHRKWL